MKRFTKIRSFAAAITALVLAAVLSACSFNGGSSISNYVSGVNDNVHEAVNLTRKLRQQQEKLDTRSPDDAAETVELLDELSELYTNLSRLEAPDRYDDIDTDLKENSKKALASISELKSLITTSQNTGSDSLYKRDSENIMAEYEEYYNNLVELSSQAQTRYRND